MAFCIDTNILVFCLRGKSPQAMRRLNETPTAQVKIPWQVLAELRVGAAKSSQPDGNSLKVDRFVLPYEVVWPNEVVLNEYVVIRCELESKGQRISEADLWIAATARACGAVLVTNNLDEFNRVPGLKVEDWSR